MTEEEEVSIFYFLSRSYFKKKGLCFELTKYM